MIPTSLKNITYPASNNALTMSKMVTDSELTLGLANNVKYLPLTCVIDIVNTKQSFFKRKLNNCVYIFIKQTA